MYICVTKNFPIYANGAENISGLRAVFMEVLGMVGMSWKNIFMSKIYMNIIEKNKENDSYRPRTICPGYTGDFSKYLYKYSGL